ncbi:MAG: bifunctional [glutamate--ammonia ligase]-adenylyl-L-tyrosine phosphorylase/[glutamate--ammonia-ligase] adenylyltransferase [Porticoccaceae bacterium]
MSNDDFLSAAEPAQVPLPEQLEALGHARVAAFRERHGTPAWLDEALADADFNAALLRVWSCSSFVFETCMTWPEVLGDLIASADLAASYGEAGYREHLAPRLAAIADEKDLHRALRQFRRREMVRIVWRDFSRVAPLLETTGDLTRLAEACIAGALDTLRPWVEEQLGTPIGRHSGREQHLVVLGMGKMGAWELNLSSDIDLIFTFPENGETRGGRKQVSNQEFFIRLAQKLIQALDANTVDGFVFRVDMRLRPYGDSGALVLNFDAMEAYYQTQGRDWERYAMVKARVVAGRAEDASRLMDVLRPFTYRKYIDFSAIQSLRDMKALISREVARQGDDNVKRGAGGIREVEFIAQAFQLIRGGKDRRFQNPSLRHILALLDEEQLLAPGEAQKLWLAYVFLRDTEHALQGMADKQTQRLPDNPEQRTIVAALMGFAHWDDFYACLAQHRALVEDVFAGIAAEAPEERQTSPALQTVRGLWLGAADGDAFERELEALGLRDAASVAHALYQLRESRAVKGMTALVRSRLDAFMPLLITQCAELDSGAETLARVLPLVDAVLRRSAYLVLMIENPQALRQLIYLCSQSLWVAQQIGRYPALLDELLDVRTLFTPADKQSIAQDLQQVLLRLPVDDLDAQMEALRHFRRAQSLRIAACEMAGALPLMKVSDNLTWLAEVILDQVLAMAQEWMVARHGYPGRADDAAPAPGLLIVGYGKLGGLELGHGSDLDLVFLHDADPALSSSGERSIDNASYFNRLCQRLLHILSTQTAGGDLYEVDTRLRPNGNSGLLVTSLAAFEKYQQEGAWTWEHQALVRARPVAGDMRLAPLFDDIRHRVLCRARDGAALRRDVIEMRDKMRAHLGSSASAGREGRFDVKQDAGGIVDIEFVVQFAVLAEAHRCPALTRWTDNMRILDSLESQQLLSGAEAHALREAYIAYRSAVHRLQLQRQKAVVGQGWENGLEHHRQAVTAVYQRLLET